MMKYEIKKHRYIWDMIHVLCIIFQTKFNGTKISLVGWGREGQQALPHKGDDQVDGEVSNQIEYSDIRNIYTKCIHIDS